MKISPFSTTPGIAGEAYINMHYADEIIQNFESPYSTQYIYKILGLRGSGKSVEYKKIMDHFSSLEKWKVYSLSSGGDKIQTLISAISREKEIENTIVTTETSFSGQASAAPLGIGIEGSGGIRETRSTDTTHYNNENTLEYMCRTLCGKGFSILIGIDDIARDDNMVEFLSIMGKLILENDIKIRIVCTGLYKNVEDFTDVPHLSFFVRPKPLIVNGLVESEIAYMYQKHLGINTTEARKLAAITKGYAWGYSLLGDLFFSKKESDSIDDVLEEFDQRMASTYHLIWKELTLAEQNFVKIILSTENGAKEEIEANMQTKGYSSLRTRLYSKHIIDTSVKGYIKINLPRFKEYIEEWQE